MTRAEVLRMIKMKHVAHGVTFILLLILTSLPTASTQVSGYEEGGGLREGTKNAIVSLLQPQPRNDQYKITNYLRKHQHQQELQQQEQNEHALVRRSLQHLESSTSIPNHLWFTYKTNIIKERKPKKYFDNIMKTMSIYEEAVDLESINFLTDEECYREVQLAYPQLIQYLDEEPEGAYRGDVCRTAALYLYGGYYFDIDMEVIQPYIAAPDVTFVSISACGGHCFFNSFIASVPKHPILRVALKKMFKVYESKDEDMHHLIGPKTLYMAYAQVQGDNRGKVHILDEIQLEPLPETAAAAAAEGDEEGKDGEKTENNNDEKKDEHIPNDDTDTNTTAVVAYPDVPRQDGWGRCNYAVHDKENEIVYFYARFVGGGGKCYKRKDHINSYSPTIRHRIWFTYSYNIIKSKQKDDRDHNTTSSTVSSGTLNDDDKDDNYNSLLYQNVLNTMDLYRTYWYEPLAPINFMDYEKCIQFVHPTEPKLLDYFLHESSDRKKVDICKLCYLYLHGGYHFDIDLKVVQPYLPDDKYKFIAVSARGGDIILGTFIASVAKHPMLKEAISFILSTYETSHSNELKQLANSALTRAYKQLSSKQKESVHFLEEIDLDRGKGSKLYPKAYKQIGEGNCNFVIHNPETEEIHFFTRFVGFRGCSPLPNDDDDVDDDYVYYEEDEQQQEEMEEEHDGGGGGDHFEEEKRL